jgi:hypothetical protein
MRVAVFLAMVMVALAVEREGGEVAYTEDL